MPLRPVTQPRGKLTADLVQGKAMTLSDGSTVTGWRDEADNYYERRRSFGGGFQWFLLETPADDDDSYSWDE